MAEDNGACGLLLSADLEVPFPTTREADIAYGSLSVDKEPKRGGCQRNMVVSGNVMRIHFEAQETKSLRVSINSFFEHLKLVTQTMDQFGPAR